MTKWLEMDMVGGSRRVIFLAIMGALGSVMFIVSQTIFATTQIALDLSHIGTFIAAIYGGPLIGMLTGLLVGIGPGIYFGYLGGSLGVLSVICTPVGKALTGWSVGYLARFLRRGDSKYSSWKIIVATLVGYLPECIYMVFYFESLVTILMPGVAAFFISHFGSIHLLVISILTKAWIEISLLSVFMGALVGNHGFNDFVSRVFTTSYIIPKLKSSKSS